MSLRFIRNYGPVIITDIFVILLMVNFFTGQLADFANEAKAWAITIGFVSMYYSTVYLNLTFIRDIRRRTAGYWGPSLWGIIIFLIFYFTGAFDQFDILASNIRWLNNNVNVPLGASMYTSSCLVLVSAIYRRFLLTSKEAAVFMFSAIAVMFMNAPIFGYIWPGFDTIANTMADLAKYGQSAMLMAAVFGMVTAGIRTITGRGGAMMRLFEEREA